MRNKKILQLCLASMFAALCFISFSYLRIEVPMGGGMTGKIYIGETFIILPAILLGCKYGGLAGAIGLTIADVLAGYTTSAPPTFIAKFLFGFSTAFIAHHIFNITTTSNDKSAIRIFLIAAIGGCLTNIITEPIIRYLFKVYILGMPPEVAYLSAVNCFVAMLVSAIPSIVLGLVLYKVLRKSIINILS